MRPVAAGFVDVGFVRATVGEAHAVERSRVRLDAAAIVRLVEKIATDRGYATLRTYWYDGQYLPEDSRYAAQLKYLDAVGQIPGLRLRLGQLIERTPAWHSELKRALGRVGVEPAVFAQHFSFAGELVQKGVDTLMVLDLVLLSQSRAYDVAILLAGDRDLSEAVRTVQDAGRKVILVVPPGRSVAAPMRTLADEVVTLTGEEIRNLQLGASPRARDTAPTDRGRVRVTPAPRPTPPAATTAAQGAVPWVRVTGPAAAAAPDLNSVCDVSVEVDPRQGVLFS